MTDLANILFLEIRCSPPEIPKNSSVVYNGNDRAFSDSFKVGSTVQYRCSLGHIVQGQSLRTCETTGFWSDAPPICVCMLFFLFFIIIIIFFYISSNILFLSDSCQTINHHPSMN